MSGLVEAFESVSAAFGGLGLRWYVFGAQAAILHGIARATADIDVTVDPGARKTAEIARALTSHGFTLRIDDEAFVERTRVLPVTHKSGVPVDVVLAGPGLEDLFFERVVHRRVGSVEVPIASAEDLIVMKVLAGRDKDLDDVRGLLTARKRDLDVEEIRETLGLLESALDQRDLLPLFERLYGSR
jgi:Nucleotidyltransferase of unknown function (DUF6036)